LSTLDSLRHQKGITAQQIDVFVNQWRQPGHVFGEHRKALSPKLLECRIDIKRVPENDDVDHESKSSELVFLSFPIALTQFAPLAVKNSSCQLVAVLATIQLSKRPPAFRLVVNIGKAVDGFVDAPEFGHSLRQANITSGPVFRKVSRGENVQKAALNPASVAWILKRALGRAGVRDLDRYGAHSLRAGFATIAFDNGVPEFKIRQQTGHKSSRMLEKYIRSEQKARQEAASSLGL
jgi:hypothetical protein